jgi:hypothetical protein
MSGFGGVSKRPYGKEFIEYPEFTKKMMERLGEISKVFDAPEAIRERVIAAVDCGFGTFVGWEMGHRGWDVGQTGDIARRDGHRVATTVEQEGGLSRSVGRSS